MTCAEITQRPPFAGATVVEGFRQGRRGKRPPGDLSWLTLCWPRLARLGGGAGSDPDFEPVGPGDAGLAHPVGGPLYPDALALGRSPGFAGAAALGAKSSSDRPGMRRGVLPDVLAVGVGHLAGDPVADFLVVVLLVLAMEGGGHLVVCLDELVDWVGRVALGFGDLPVDVVEASLVVRVVCVVRIPAVLDTGPVRRYDGCGWVVRLCGAGAGDGSPTARGRRFDCGWCRRGLG
jgi:hypothetical protein